MTFTCRPGVRSRPAAVPGRVRRPSPQPGPAGGSAAARRPPHPAAADADRPPRPTRTTDAEAPAAAAAHHAPGRPAPAPAATRAVALTFDDGPDPTWTPQVLDQLRAAGVKATFCLVGTQVQALPGAGRPGSSARATRSATTAGTTTSTWARRPVAEIRADLRPHQRGDPGGRTRAPGSRTSGSPGGRWTPEVVAVARSWACARCTGPSTRRTGPARPPPAITTGGATRARPGVDRAAARRRRRPRPHPGRLPAPDLRPEAPVRHRPAR